MRYTIFILFFIYSTFTCFSLTEKEKQEIKREKKLEKTEKKAKSTANGMERFFYKRYVITSKKNIRKKSLKITKIISILEKYKKKNSKKYKERLKQIKNLKADIKILKLWPPYFKQFRLQNKAYIEKDNPKYQEATKKMNEIVKEYENILPKKFPDFYVEYSLFVQAEKKKTKRSKKEIKPQIK